MRIGLLSDTHIPEAALTLPPQVKDAFRDVDLILHAGDIYDPGVLDELERLAPVMAARGDDDHLALFDLRIQQEHLLTVAGMRLWLIHAMPARIYGVWLMHTAQRDELLDSADIMVFGHTHRALVDRLQGVLLVNPGSPTFPNYQPILGTVSVLTIASGKAEASIIQLR